jgi:hypothetical protein
LLLDLKQNKTAVIKTVIVGERLLRSLWKAGYEVRLEESADGSLFLLPVGKPRITKEQWEVLFADYEAHHDAGLWTLLARLPKARDGRPDWRWWNRVTSASRGGGLWCDLGNEDRLPLNGGNWRTRRQ